MANCSGDLTEIKFIHEEVGSKIFSVKSGESANQDLGGYSNTDYMMNGNGTGHAVKSAKRWAVDSIQVDITFDGALEFLQDIANNVIEAIIEISSIDGSVYKGKGTIIGDIKEDTLNGYVTIEVGGAGKLEKIA